MSSRTLFVLCVLDVTGFAGASMQMDDSGTSPLGAVDAGPPPRRAGACDDARLPAQPATRPEPAGRHDRPTSTPVAAIQGPRQRGPVGVDAGDGRGNFCSGSTKRTNAPRKPAPNRISTSGLPAGRQHVARSERSSSSRNAHRSTRTSPSNRSAKASPDTQPRTARLDTRITHWHKRIALLPRGRHAPAALRPAAGQSRHFPSASCRPTTPPHQRRTRQPMATSPEMSPAATCTPTP